ncbi:hypothetical protein AAFF_G00362660 [Aldrovandia affinis]|uniref:Uncharacterized protein n=1 Tax=Aldrovandia affinis TaxID=143900 RepID=A0AAD7SIW7_9TELE|nr:hypothetical protein AAFF_G00362660 [Aldrovandia affinis]
MVASNSKVLENYNKGKTALLSAAKIMVSPTEVDLMPDTFLLQPTPTTHHRRNSSVRSCVHSEISLGCFSEFPPPSVSGFLGRAQEHLAVGLWGRQAPLALTESLSDGESLYSLDVPRGYPSLGALPFPINAPIPEEDPSLCSLTQLPSALDQEPGQSAPCCKSYSSPIPLTQTVKDQGLHQAAPNPYSNFLSIRGRDCLPSIALPSLHCSPTAPPSTRASPKKQEEEEEEEEKGEEGGEKREGGEARPRIETEPPSPDHLAPQPNGAPSQVVLEFSQFLDSLFKLDRSCSPLLRFWDDESELGRGSYDQEEGMRERSPLGPDRAPKPPHPIPGSADQSSSISPSSSFPLSSSGELNDLSPSDGGLTTTHPLRTTAIYSGESVLSSLV